MADSKPAAAFDPWPTIRLFTEEIDWEAVVAHVTSQAFLDERRRAATLFDKLKNTPAFAHLERPFVAEPSPDDSSIGATATHVHRWCIRGVPPQPASEAEAVTMLRLLLVNIEGQQTIVRRLLSATFTLYQSRLGLEDHAAHAHDLVAALQIPTREMVLPDAPTSTPLGLPAFRRYVENLIASLEMFITARRLRDGSVAAAARANTVFPAATTAATDKALASSGSQEVPPQHAPLKLAPALVTVALNRNTRQAVVNGREFTIDGRVFTMLGRIDEAAAKYRQDHDMEDDALEPGILPVEAEGKYASDLRGWWKSIGGLSEPIKAVGTNRPPGMKRKKLYFVEWKVAPPVV